MRQAGRRVDGAHHIVRGPASAREIGFGADDESILVAQARAGSSAVLVQVGVCGPCRAKLVEGRVRMDRKLRLEPADLQAGLCSPANASLTEK